MFHFNMFIFRKISFQAGRLQLAACGPKFCNARVDLKDRRILRPERSFH